MKRSSTGLVNITHCTSTGIYIGWKVHKITPNNHGYKANSFARKGIEPFPRNEILVRAIIPVLCLPDCLIVLLV